MNDLFEISVSLREVHATMKRFWGNRFTGMVNELWPELVRLGKTQKCGPVVAAIRSAKDCPAPIMAATILAVVVEAQLRETRAVMSEGKS